MYEAFRTAQFGAYREARQRLLTNLDSLALLERYVADEVVKLLSGVKDEILRDFNEASYLYPFWQNYPPSDRGRQPKGDQFPWIEVGEHTIGRKLSRILPDSFCVRDTGLPSGPDERFIISSNAISTLLDGLTNSAWLFSDIKSVGPRDEVPSAVMSHNQISGDGLWENASAGVMNTILRATGRLASHDFHCTIPPLYVLSDGTIAPVIQVVIKPIYRMLSLIEASGERGQPIKEIVVITIPNGLLLKYGPAYLTTFPGLFFPGKDDKTKDTNRLRARVNFNILKEIAPWRLQRIDFME
jgi:hypothetical protein